MKAIVFDSGPLITLALNSLLHLIPQLKKHYKGDFYIPTGVKKEIIDVPITSKRFSLEAMQISHILSQKHVEFFDTKNYSQETNLITTLSNSIFSIGKKNLTILNRGELDSLVLAKNIGAEAVVVDERTTRLLLENPYRLHKYLEKKFRHSVKINKENLKEFEKHFSTIKIIRSVELALVAVDLGLLDHLMKGYSKKKLVDSLLWAMKLKGCAVSEIEIKRLVKLYSQN